MIKSSSASLLINELITLYNDNNNSFERGERRRELITACVNYSRSPQARSIFKFLTENKATTQPELSKTLHINYQTVSRHVRTLVNLGVIKITSNVGKPYRVGSGRPIPIYIMADADPSVAGIAQRRLGELIKSETFNKENFAKLQAETVNEWAARVEELLPVGLEGKLKPVYEAIRKAGVPPALIPEVKDRVIEMRVRKVPGPVGVDPEEAGQ